LRDQVFDVLAQFVLSLALLDHGQIGLLQFAVAFAQIGQRVADHAAR
jgi:hypothetical protein